MSTLVPVVAPVISIVVALGGCSSADDVVSSVVIPVVSGSEAVAGDHMVLSDPGGYGEEFEVTAVQRAFLDGLQAQGVEFSSELRALSIGSYVCQAHAAGQNEQAVWDGIAPMVRSERAELHAVSPQTVTEVDVHAGTAHYIRIAFQELC